MQKKLVRIGEVAARFSVHPFTVQRWTKQGLLTALRDKRGVRYFKPEDVEKLAQERAPQEVK